MVTRADLVAPEELAAIKTEIRRWGTAAVMMSRFFTTRCISPIGEVQSIEELRGRRVTAFCGIGNPEAFRKTIESSGVRLDDAAFLSFPDHYHYSPEDIGDVVNSARAIGADLILCTVKDLVKIVAPPAGGPPIFAIDIGLDILDGRGDWETRLDVIAQAAKRKPHNPDSDSGTTST
jgi:tetraacyldisaccharide 4'-kinase